MKLATAKWSDTRFYRAAQAVAVAWDIRRGSWWEPEIEVLSYAVHRGETVVDIGANFGLYTYHLSRAVGRTGRVVAFEPVPSTFATLHSVLRLLQIRNAWLIPKGCGAVPGRVEFKIPLQESGAPAAGLAFISERARGATSERAVSVVCDVVPADEIVFGLGQLSFIKCDIEGAELFALRGASRSLEQYRPTLLCEVTPSFMAGFDLSPRDLTAYLEGMGYSAYAYGRNETPRMRRMDVASELPAGNYLFVHTSRLSRLADLLSGEAVRALPRNKRSKR